MLHTPHSVFFSLLQIMSITIGTGRFYGPSSSSVDLDLLGQTSVSLDEWAGKEYPSINYVASRIPNSWGFVTSWHAGNPSPKSHFRIDFLGCLPRPILQVFQGLMPQETDSEAEISHAGILLEGILILRNYTHKVISKTRLEKRRI